MSSSVSFLQSGQMSNDLIGQYKAESRGLAHKTPECRERQKGRVFWLGKDCGLVSSAEIWIAVNSEPVDITFSSSFE